jgi:hypothetical protein
MASDKNFIVSSHNGIDVAIRLCEVVEIEVRAKRGRRPTLAVSDHDEYGLIRIGKEKAPS